MVEAMYSWKALAWVTCSLEINGLLLLLLLLLGLLF